MIRQIVFDVGRVLVRLEPERLLGLLAAAGAPQTDLEAVTGRIDLLAHETGRLDGAGLLQQIAALAPRPLERVSLQAAWVAMLAPDFPMLQLASRLRARYEVYLLSNVGDLHWQHLSQQLALESYALDVIRSYEVGVMKPDPAIYVLAEARFGLNPEATVFIDDRADNIASATARGWHGIVHRDHDDSCEQLRRFGVITE